MLYEDQQVGRPLLQLLYIVEVFALVIRLEVRESTNPPQKQVRTKKPHDIVFSCHFFYLLTSARSFSKSSSSAPMMLMAGLEH